MNNSKMLQFPAAERNKGFMLEVLKENIDVKQSGTGLEIASGSGTHIALFAQNFPNIQWQPSELDQECLKSISAYKSHYGLSNLEEPLELDITKPVETWNYGKCEDGSHDVIVNMNMIHISPWSTAIGLFKAAGFLLKPGGSLFLYGPFAIHGKLFPQSNVNFDLSLKERNSEWGVRDVDDVEKLAVENKLMLHKMVDMPANNRTIIFKKL